MKALWPKHPLPSIVLLLKSVMMYVRIIYILSLVLCLEWSCKSVPGNYQQPKDPFATRVDVTEQSLEH